MQDVYKRQELRFHNCNVQSCEIKTICWKWKLVVRRTRKHKYIKIPSNRVNYFPYFRRNNCDQNIFYGFQNVSVSMKDAHELRQECLSYLHTRATGAVAGCFSSLTAVTWKTYWCFLLWTRGLIITNICGIFTTFPRVFGSDW